MLKSHLTSSREEAGYGQACGLLSYSCYLHYTNRYLHSIGRAAQPLSQVIFISDFYAVSLYLLPGFYGVPVSLPHSFLQWSLPYSSLQWSLHYSSLQWSCSVFSTAVCIPGIHAQTTGQRVLSGRCRVMTVCIYYGHQIGRYKENKMLWCVEDIVKTHYFVLIYSFTY